MFSSHLVRKLLVLAVSLALIVLFACSKGLQRDADFKPTILLISLDGFRWDYFSMADTPTLDRLIDGGVKADGLIPVFPSKTFPNHYSLVTGKYTENHGIVSNSMYDAEMDGSFSMGNRAAVQDGRWWGGEPIWVTAEKAGMTTSAFFWPGSEAEIQGHRPTFWQEYDGQMTHQDRISQVLNWLELPQDERPQFITLYFSDVDGQSHRFGPTSDEALQAVGMVDSVMAILIAGLESRDLLRNVDILITSDHGMADASIDRVIFLDDYIDLDDVRIIDWSPVAAMIPKDGKTQTIYAALAGSHPNMKVYKKTNIPPRLHYSKHQRIPEIIAIADEGWAITNHEYFEPRKDRFRRGGIHGYDNQVKSMWGIFVAHGPSFKAKHRIAAFETVHIYNLMAHILNLDPAPNDGDWNVLRGILK